MSVASPRLTVGQNRQHRHGAAKIVGHQQEPPGRMDAHIGRTGAAGADGVEQLQMPVGPIDGEGADRAFLVLRPLESVSLAEYRRVPAAFKARQLGLVPIS